MMQRAVRLRLRRVRRVGFTVALTALVAAPVMLLPGGAIAEPESPWPFSLVPRAAWRGSAPTPAESGNVIPVEFRLGGFRGLEVLRREAPLSIAVDCASRSPRTVAFPPSVPAEGVLTYDWSTETYTFWWPRADVWVGTCRRLILELNDDSVHAVMVEFGEASTLIVP